MHEKYMIKSQLKYKFMFYCSFITGVFIRNIEKQGKQDKMLEPSNTKQRNKTVNKRKHLNLETAEKHKNVLFFAAIAYN